MALTEQHPRAHNAGIASGHEPGADGGLSPAARAKRSESARLRREQRLDDELAQGFPASDPPSWVLGIASMPPQS